MSLCRSAQYIYDLGKSAAGEFTQAPDEAEVDALRMRSEPARGPIRHLAPVLKMSETATRWERPTPVLGGDEPSWPEV